MKNVATIKYAGQSVQQGYVEQCLLFDFANVTKIKKESESKIIKFRIPKLDFRGYNENKYIEDLRKYGIENLWDEILEFSTENKKDAFLNLSNFGELYEKALAEQDKENKKESGQYFTPDDVSNLMSRWLVGLEGENVCDVCCGTGNLILAYLKEVGEVEAKQLLNEGKIYLYDCDHIALKIAKCSIEMIYGKDLAEKVNIICGDFLYRDITLPQNAKVISNPPYAKIVEFKPSWERTKNLFSSKDFYSAIIEKIALSNSKAVIISPYSFLGAKKFYHLREVLNDYSGFVVSFDNVPANIFNGRKHGIFNSNTANSVRAAITVIDNTGEKGFRTSHLIRFKTEERENLFKNGTLECFVSSKKQVVTEENQSYVKCHKELENAFIAWKEKSNKTLKDLLSNKPNNYPLYVPNTCRYFTTAAIAPLSRAGGIILYAKDEECYDLLYCMINSSFAYWHWRLYDGGITYPIGLLEELPIFDNLLTNEDKEFFREMRKEMSALEKLYIVTKLNAGVHQENIKFPPDFREKLNTRFFEILKIKESHTLLELVHSNAVFN
ncbi:MAG: N-6 DNA methylase [Firmicutes bacterium]|nr:N-6 DNA methylase [Bacillota bacterium]